MKFAMGNAVEILKKEADHMLPDCDHNGVTEGAALLEMMTTSVRAYVQNSFRTILQSASTA